MILTINRKESGANKNAYIFLIRKTEIEVVSKEVKLSY
jgi:hypothetical protein